MACIADEYVKIRSLLELVIVRQRYPDAMGRKFPSRCLPMDVVVGQLKELSKYEHLVPTAKEYSEWRQEWHTFLSNNQACCTPVKLLGEQEIIAPFPDPAYNVAALELDVSLLRGTESVEAYERFVAISRIQKCAPLDLPAGFHCEIHDCVMHCTRMD